MLKRLMDIAGGLVGEYAEYIAGLSDRKVIMQIEDEEYITLNNPVLHCTELEKVFVKRNSDDITGIRPEYQELKKRKSEDIESRFR